MLTKSIKKIRQNSNKSGGHDAVLEAADLLAFSSDELDGRWVVRFAQQ